MSDRSVAITGLPGEYADEATDQVIDTYRIALAEGGVTGFGPEAVRQVIVTYDRVKAERGRLRDALRAELAHCRCGFTGNPSGTDTWPADRPCPCDHCQRWLRLTAALEGKSWS